MFNTGPYGAGNFKMLLPKQFSSDLIQTSSVRTLATMVEYRILLFSAIAQVLKKN